MAEEMSLLIPERRSKVKRPATKDPVEKCCLCCNKGFEVTRSYPRQDFCSKECKLITWAGRTFIKAYKAGKAPGLKGLIESLCRGSKIEVKR